MAKITRYSKDTLGQYLLLTSGLLLNFWLVMAGLNASNPPAPQPAVDSSANTWIWYYLGVPVVGALWGLANYERDPSSFGSRRLAAIMYLIMGSLIGAVMWMFMFTLRYPDRVREILLGS